MLPSPSTPVEKLGFEPPAPVSTLRTIAQRFGASRPRCGIYLLEFPEQRFYIGQAVEVVRRFAQHRKNYDEIVGFSFIPVRSEKLDQIERDLIRKAESLGLVILNTVHACNVVGDTDLDMVVSPNDQAEWLSRPADFNNLDTSGSIVLPDAQVARFAEQFRRFDAHPLVNPASDILRTYVRHCIPAPKRTEYSFWVVSCLPSTNRDTWPRLLCVSAGVMELLVIGHHKSRSSDMWGFVTVASDVLSETFLHRADVWRFMAEPGVPFTNNLAEQALRMCKVKQKISGCFRTVEGADTFFTIRSYLQTMTKQKQNLLQCLTSVFNGQPIQPQFVG